MNHELLSAARALGTSTHVNAFGDVVLPKQMGSAGITYLRGDLEIVLELLKRLPAGSVKITCGSTLKFTVLLDDHTPIAEYSDLPGAAVALAQLITTLSDGMPQAACA